MPDKKNYAMDLLLSHAGNHPQANHGIVNPPVYHASTVLDSTVEQMERAQKDRLTGVFYGRYGNVKPETMRAATAWSPDGPALRLHAGLEAVEDLIADLEDGFQRLTAA